MRAFSHHPIGFGASFGPASSRPEAQLRACQNETENTAETPSLSLPLATNPNLRALSGRPILSKRCMYWVVGTRLGTRCFRY